LKNQEKLHWKKGRNFDLVAGLSLEGGGFRNIRDDEHGGIFFRFQRYVVLLIDQALDLKAHFFVDLLVKERGR